MSKILVNYIYNKSRDEYKLLPPDCVFADKNVAILESEEDIRTPLVIPVNGKMIVVDREDFEAIHKEFVLSATNTGKVKEDPNGNIRVWLPKDTKVSELRIYDGQLVKVELEDTEKEKKPRKPKQKKEA